MNGPSGDARPAAIGSRDRKGPRSKPGDRAEDVVARGVAQARSNAPTDGPLWGQWPLGGSRGQTWHGGGGAAPGIFHLWRA